MIYQSPDGGHLPSALNPPRRVYRPFGIAVIKTTENILHSVIRDSDFVGLVGLERKCDGAITPGFGISVGAVCSSDMDPPGRVSFLGQGFAGFATIPGRLRVREGTRGLGERYTL